MSAAITIFDIADAAGVSLATADRALNHRKGVATATAKRVLDAAERLGWAPNVVAQSLSRRTAIDVHVILPESDNPFICALVQAFASVREAFRPYRLVPQLVSIPERDPAALAAAIESLAAQSGGLAVLGLDSPDVRAAVDAAVNAGTPVVTIVSDVPGSRRNAYVGIDNLAAGRTAATLMGRFVGSAGGRVALFAGDRLYADLVDREAGFRGAFAERFSGPLLMPSLWEVEDDAAAARAATALLADHPDLSGIYIAGGGLSGIAGALIAAERRDVVVIGHDLVGDMHDLLQGGVADAAISQDPQTQMLHAVKLLGELAMRGAPPSRIELTAIAIYLADNLPASHRGD